MTPAVVILCSASTLILACASRSDAVDSRDERRLGSELLPRSYEDCRAARGEIEAADRGARCFSYFTPRRDASAYAACRDAGGTPRAVGPGRSVAGDSHVCTLVFSPHE